MKSPNILTGNPPLEWRGLRRSAAPVATLVFLSPVLAELLTGILRLSNLWLLLPEMAVYGTAAVIIREVVRRLRGGWRMLLVLGLAYAVAEECVILQTSLTPQFFPTNSFGLVAGVQWIYLAALVWYESVYAIVLPITLVEMLFPQQRHELWLSKRGLWIAGGIFVLASAGVYELWHRVGLQKYGPSSYHVPPTYVLAALVVIAVLVGMALLLPRGAVAAQSRRGARSPWLVGVMALGFGLAWFVLIALPYLPPEPFRGVSPAAPIAVGLAWLALGLFILSRVSRGAGWSDRHRLAVIFGMSLASMLGGTLLVLAFGPLDILGKFGFDLVAILLFIWLAVRLPRTEAADRG
jgi:hypothetical protein